MFLILTNLEVVRQSNTDLCHLGLFRAPAELFDVSDVGWVGVGGGRMCSEFFLR